LDTIIEKLSPVLRIVEIPLKMAGVTLSGWQHLAYLAVLIVFVFFMIRRFIRKSRFRMEGGAMADSADIDALLQSKGSFNNSQQALAVLRANQDQLKKMKQWDQLGTLYAEANSPSDAARYFMKAKMFKEAAAQYAQMGKSAKAAKMMLKSGDFENAGLFFMQQAMFVPAGKAFVKGGHTALAADAYGKGKKGKEAIALYLEYFTSPRDNETLQLKTAESCYALLSDENLMFNVNADAEKALCEKVAQIFEHVDRYDVAAELFNRSGNKSRAGEVYLLAGNLEKAAAAMKEAGREKDAARIGARFYEQQGKWREAAMAYAGAGEYAKSAECFSKANEPVRAGEYY
jgi:tetratricopeptide (TPR) repeat protein